MALTTEVLLICVERHAQQGYWVHSLRDCVREKLALSPIPSLVDPVNEPLNLVAWIEMFEKGVRVVRESLKEELESVNELQRIKQEEVSLENLKKESWF